MLPAVLMILAVLAGVFYMKNSISQAETIPSSTIRNQLEVMYNGTIDQLRLDDDNYDAQLTRAGSVYALIIEGDTGKVLSMELVSAAPELAAAADGNQTAAGDEGKKDSEDKKGIAAGGDRSSAPSEAAEHPAAAAPAAQSKAEAKPAAGSAQPAKQQPAEKAPAAPAVQPKPKPAPAPAVKQPAQQQTPPKTVLLTEQQAIQIALRQLKGEVDDVDFIKTTDGGYYLVEIEIDVDDGPDEATYQIHAISGKIMSVTWDD